MGSTQHRLTQHRLTGIRLAVIGVLLALAVLTQPAVAASADTPADAADITLADAPVDDSAPFVAQQPSGPGPAPAQVPRPPAATAPPAGGSVQGVWLWQRTEFSDGTTVTVADPSKYVLGLLADGRMTLRADCNQGSGTYTVSGPQLSIQPGPMTLAACPVGSQDTLFLRDLRRVATFVHDGENLVLNMQIDSGNMVFSPQPAASLTDTPWRVQSVNNGRGGAASVVQGTQLSAMFTDDGTVSGETGCNSFRGPYTVTGQEISFGALASTRRACTSDAANAQEQAFLNALAASTRMELSGDRLTLRNAAGATQVILVR